jgi:hypothetical protein
MPKFLEIVALELGSSYSTYLSEANLYADALASIGCGVGNTDFFMSLVRLKFVNYVLLMQLEHVSKLVVM